MGRKFAAVVFSLGCLQASSALALGLGELKLESNLNEPLKARVDLLNTQGLHEDEIRIRLGTREDFKRLGLDRNFFLTSIQFEVVVDDSGRARIMMSTDDPVLEPYLDFIIEARWPSGRLLREYTVLIDPPTFTQATPVVSASERVEQVEGIPAPGKKKIDQGADTGTRVDVKKSDLGPGEMPQRDFNASAGGQPVAGGRYMIARDDTLWEIASAARPEGASVHQTMLDIQRLNPDAFINNNINRVKAGYIIYLPSADDISSGDLAAALAEVREQNSAWREGRDAEATASTGPSLKISADPVAPAEDQPAADQHQAGAALGDDLEVAQRDLDDTEAKVAALEEQLQTLQRIVDVKDDQIAALQSALAEGGAAEVDAEVQPVDETAPEELPADAVAQVEDAEPEDAVAPEAATEQVSEPAVAETPAVTPPVQAEKSGGLMDYLWYGVGAAVLALLGLLFARRRKQGDDGAETQADEAFSGVALREPEIAVQREEPASVDSLADEMEAAAPLRDDRGYGERKHDAYASDVDAADALAEADIYIAYGRHQQAIDLLNNALVNEPNNPVYRLKLLEIYTELNNPSAASNELEKIRASGDVDSTARGEELLAGLEAQAQESTVIEPAEDELEGEQDLDEGPGLSANPLELMEDSGESLEADFSGLEIEDSSDEFAAAEDDLDLSADFDQAPAGNDEEELVIAADANGLSTKLDLARAYMDMGDEEGARQILDEIVAEGSEELKAEARTLLDRIG